MSLLEQELLTLPEHLRSPPILVGSIFSFICMFCRSLFVLLDFFFWPLCCLFIFDIQILITSLVSSNSSHYKERYNLEYNTKFRSINIITNLHWYGRRSNSGTWKESLTCCNIVEKQMQEDNQNHQASAFK